MGRDLFSAVQFNVLSTISFSIVVPAVFETAQLMRSFHWIERFASGPLIPATRAVFIGLFIIGLTMLTAMLVWPEIFYPFAWTSLLFIFEPINYWTGRPAFSRGVATRRLAHRHLALTWCARVRTVLGDVELLLISQVGLSHPSARLLAHIRNAAAWVWRIRSVRAGAVCVEEFPVAEWAGVKELIRKLGKRSGANAQRSKEIWQIVFGWTSQKFSFNVKTAHTLKNS